MKGRAIGGAHPGWSLLQQLVVRGCAAGKFFYAAHVLGPAALGDVLVVLLVIAVAESLTDTGLQQAVVQGKLTPDAEVNGSIFTLGLARGWMVSVALALLAPVAAASLNAPSATHLVVLAALIPSIRAAVSPGLYHFMRTRRVREIAAYEALVATADVGAAAVMLGLGFGGSAVILSVISAECLRVFLTWTLFRVAVKPNLGWSRLSTYMVYGRWIWATSSLTVLLNQADKILVARLLGPAELAIYQMAARVAQLGVADAAIALGNYLFPAFSESFRESSAAAKRKLRNTARPYVAAFLVLALLLASCADFIVRVILGPEWVDAISILRVMAGAMFFGAVIALLVAYVKAIGQPRSIFLASMAQLVVLVISAYLLAPLWGGLGMAVAVALSLFSTVIVLQMTALRS